MTATSGSPILRRRNLALLPALLVIALLASAASACASTITLGPPLNTGAFTQTEVHDATTALNFGLPEPGTVVISPVNGLIVDWHIVDGRDGPLQLRVLQPQGGTTYTGVGTSAAVFPAGPGLETFPVALPIKVGEVVGIDFGAEADIGIAEVKSPAGISAWKPPLGDGQTLAASFSQPVELAYNADVLPAPAIAAVKPPTGSFKGRVKVTISGTDLGGASAVSFGGVPASSFTVESESQISAVAPAGNVGPVGVAVTTVAGTSPTAEGFSYIACVVPSLHGKSLRRARRALSRNHCKLGKFRRRAGVSARAGRVVRQNRHAGGKLAPGTPVAIVLG